MRLSELKEADIVKVIDIKLNHKTQKYLESMGLTYNTQIKMVKKAIFTGPIIIFLKNYQLCISDNIASKIIVDRI